MIFNNNELETSIAIRKLKLMSSTTRHDITNQLFAASGYLELASELSKDATQGEYLKNVEKAIKAIREHLLFARDYENIGIKEPRWQKVSSIIQCLDKKEIPIHDWCSELSILADPMLKKVFFNLIDNTIRHSETATVVNIHYNVSEYGVVLIYEDNGIGILADQKEKIFEKDFGKNTGLGLFLIREILSITGITICETGTHGARFEIFVPKGKYIIRGDI